jgi:dihydroxyacetone synthase
MRASGWAVLDVLDGSHDVQAICAALEHAKNLKGKPVFVNIRTVIGVGTTVQGTAKAHHGAFDVDSVAASKRLAGQDPSTTHSPAERGLSFFRERKTYGKTLEEDWNRLVTDYEARYPEKAAEFAQRRAGDLNSHQLTDLLTALDISQFKGMATREANGLIMQKLWEKCPALSGGGADLVTSNKFLYSETDVFLPSAGFQGRYIRYGIREHAMAAISNGLAAYGPGTFLPVTATFLIFYLYVSIILPSSIRYLRL